MTVFVPNANSEDEALEIAGAHADPPFVYNTLQEAKNGYDPEMGGDIYQIEVTKVEDNSIREALGI